MTVINTKTNQSNESIINSSKYYNDQSLMVKKNITVEKIKEFSIYLLEIIKNSYLTNKILNFSGASIKIIKNIIWPYETIPNGQPQRSFFTDIIQRAASSKSSEALPEEIDQQQYVNLEPYAKTALIIGQIYLSVLIGSSEGNFAETMVTTQAIMHTPLSMLSPALSRNTLNQYYSIKNNEIDHYMYLGTLNFLASTVDTFTYKTLTLPIKVSVAIAATSPQMQKCFLTLPGVKQVNGSIHIALQWTRKQIHNPIKGLILNQLKDQIRRNPDWIERQEITIRTFLNSYVEDLVDTTSNDEMSFSSWLFNYSIKPLVMPSVEETLEQLVKKSLDGTANIIADMAINTFTGVISESIKAYYLPQVLKKTCEIHPILGAASIIIEGGAKQTVRDLSIRVASAAVLIYTGSGVMSTLVLYGPSVIDYIVWLRGRHLQKVGIANETALSYFQRSSKELLISARELTKATETNKHTQTLVRQIVLSGGSSPVASLFYLFKDLIYSPTSPNHNQDEIKKEKIIDEKIEQKITNPNIQVNSNEFKKKISLKGSSPVVSPLFHMFKNSCYPDTTSHQIQEKTAPSSIEIKSNEDCDNHYEYEKKIQQKITNPDIQVNVKESNITLYNPVTRKPFESDNTISSTSSSSFNLDNVSTLIQTPKVSTKINKIYPENQKQMNVKESNMTLYTPPTRKPFESDNTISSSSFNLGNVSTLIQTPKVSTKINEIYPENQKQLTQNKFFMKHSFSQNHTPIKNKPPQPALKTIFKLWSKTS